tara:strand:+ start:189 stop:1091 length:903 start_codon:yes stop_codon:yes gene_type:complete
MTLYYLQEEMGIFLNDILKKLLNEINSQSLSNIAITWINYKKVNSTIKRFGFGINNKLPIYPASIVKLIYAFALYEWIQKGKLTLNDQINAATYKMLFNSSNDATSFIVDILTGTTSGPSLNEEIWEDWKFQRQIINDWLMSLNWKELNGINCCQKTWEDGPFGREKDFYGTSNENINQISTDGTAKIFEEIMMNIEYSEKNINIKYFLERNLNKDSYIYDPNNQIEGFLGEGIPNNIPYWSKAGLMSKVRHDAAWWSINEDNQTLLVVFGNSPEFAQNKLFFPKLAESIYDFNLNFRLI